MKVKRKFQPWVFWAAVALHLSVAYAICYGNSYGFSLKAWITAAVSTVLTLGSVTVVYHRLYTHESFKCKKFLEFFGVVFAGGAIQGTAKTWEPVHTLHHAYTDQPDKDPHTPKQYPGLKGFLWSHIGWIFYEVVPPPGYKLSTKLKGNAIVEWQSKYYLIIALASLLIPLAIAGWDGFWLAGILRIAFVLHLTWSVNSLGHVFGFKPRKKDGSINKDFSRNVPGFSLITGGEARHGDHHNNPNAAFFATRWWHVEPGKWFLVVSEWFGIVWAINRP